jgi:diketogulonate reductase-like aldo/keto reductase
VTRVRTAAFGPTGIDVPVIGQGTFGIGEREGPAAAEGALRAGLDLGLVHVDTAEIYGDGRVEEIVGRAIAGRRDEVFLASKVWPTNASRLGTLRSCEASLRRLRTDHLDLYLLHRPGPSPMAETFAAFESLIEAGKIRAWGVSNFGPRDLLRAVATAGPGNIACNQVSYHLDARWAEGRLSALCATNGIALVAYSPLGGGTLPDPASPRGRVLAAVAAEAGISPAAAALAFLTRRPHVFAIPRSSREHHLRENASGGFMLSPSQVERLDRAFAFRPGLRTRIGAMLDRRRPAARARGG